MSENICETRPPNISRIANPKLLFFAKFSFFSKHSLAPRQRNFNFPYRPPVPCRYYYTSIVETKYQKIFAKLDLQISAELPNTKQLFFAKITFFENDRLAPRQRNFNTDPPGLLSNIYYYTSIVKTKCR